MQSFVIIAVWVIVVIVTNFMPNLLGHKIASPDKDWVDILSALGTPIIALMTAFIAFQQLISSEKARKHKLSDRYLACYDKLAEVLAKSLASDEVSRETLFLTFSALQDAELFLSSEVISVAREIKFEIIRLRSAQRNLKNARNEEQYEKLYEQEEGIISRLGKISLNSVFRKYLADE